MAKFVDLSYERILKEQSEILLQFNFIEMLVATLITNFYFKKISKERAYFFSDILYDPSITAYVKIRFLKNILKQKKIDHKVCDKLAELNRIRNLFAHVSYVHEDFDKNLDKKWYARKYSNFEKPIDLNEQYKIFIKLVPEVHDILDDLEKKLLSSRKKI